MYTGLMRCNHVYTYDVYYTLICDQRYTVDYSALIAVPATTITARGANAAAKPQKGGAMGIKAHRDAALVVNKSAARSLSATRGI